ncbi:hypothetical protein OG735_23105 [Streptomyces sp. NBC_01210]|uniref:hypothetical protein n=1 Tax=Streptomyces sp. NBC_01210 TaxID=2903774 RepID=UPI002E148503|nr:hypothetical protein OG735_23105 [Streptomyces sp. NBC_01210]
MVRTVGLAGRKEGAAEVREGAADGVGDDADADGEPGADGETVGEGAAECVVLGSDAVCTVSGEHDAISRPAATAASPAPVRLLTAYAPQPYSDSGRKVAETGQRRPLR